MIDDLELPDFQRKHAAEIEQLTEMTHVVLVDEPIRVQLFDLSRAAEN